MCAHRCNHRLIAIAAIAVALSACQNVPMLPGLTTHQIEIQQGNVVTQEMIDKLKPGMTRQQVRFVMGTPPIVDPFHKDRWDYVYFVNKAGKFLEHRRLVLLFDGEALKRVEGDVVVGSGGTGAAKPEASSTGATVKPRETAAGKGGTGTAKPEASGAGATVKPQEPNLDVGKTGAAKPEASGAGAPVKPQEPTADVSGTAAAKPEAVGPGTTAKPRESTAEDGATGTAKPEAAGAGTAAKPHETTTAEGQAGSQTDKQVTP